MIPLRSSEGVSKFPYLSLFWVVLLILIHIVWRGISLIWPEAGFENLAFVPAKSESHFYPAFLFHLNGFSLLLNVIFLWAFTPRLFERRSPLLVFVGALLGAYLSLWTFGWLHPYSLAPVFSPEAFTGILLGMYMRRDIWGSVETVVVGPGWIRVMSVPSYVLLFFWFFYLLIANLMLEAPYSDSPMLYWIPFFSFLMGFLYESFLLFFNYSEINKFAK
jgi:hypothetical protein